MNVLVLLSDEHHPDLLGCAGHPFVQTPNIDALAARGTRFTRAWSPSPICVPARASLATGRHVHEIGYWDNALAYDGAHRGWGHRLQSAGVQVESIGKLHYRDATAPTGFDAQHEALHVAGGTGQVWGSVRDPMPESAGPSPLFDQLGAGDSRYNQFDRRVADRAVDWLGAHAGKRDPWVLFVGLVAPHFPLVVPDAYLDRYPVDTMPLPDLLPRNGYMRHPWVEAQARHSPHDAALGTDDRRRLALACYHGLVTFMDEQVGRILQALDAAGLADETLVIYSSDHGDNMGRRGLWNKCVLYRDSTGIPMIAAGPSMPRGHVCRTNVSLVDLHQTILYGVRVPLDDDDWQRPGRNLPGIAHEPDDPARTGFSQYHAVGSPSGAYMVVRGRFKYHHYVGFAPELFDLEADPRETRDLAPDAAYRPVLDAMARELRAMLDPEATDRRAKNDQNALIARHGGRDRALGIGPKGATPAP